MSPGKVVAIFGGGGAKAATDLGAARALQEAGLAPAHFVATSLGAVMAAMLAAGLDPEEALHRVAAVASADVVSFNPWLLVLGVRTRSVLREAPLRATIARLVPARKFSDLKLPLTITATDLDTGELALLGAGGADAPLVDALYATCALPLWFPPARIDGRRLADGGLRAVLPIEVALRFAPAVVAAIDAGPGFDEAKAPGSRPLPALLEAHSESEGILMAAATAAALERWRTLAGRPPLLYVRPRVERGATFRVEIVRRYADEGYRAAVEAIGRFRAEVAPGDSR